MAIFYYNVKTIQRAKGSSAVGAAAYRSATRLYDERLARFYNFSHKSDVVHSEILTPPEQSHLNLDRSVLWNRVEASERRRDAQVAREITFALPREFSPDECVKFAREFVVAELVSLGMIADLNVHWDPSAGERPQPHVHVLLTTRRAAPNVRGATPESLNFGLKVLEWRGVVPILQWRERLAEHLNVRLAQLGFEVHLDPSSFKAQGVQLEPQRKIGAAAARRRAQGRPADRVVQSEDIAARNGDRIIADPRVALNALTRQLATFTRSELEQFLHRHSGDAEQRDAAMRAVLQAPQIRPLGRDSDGRERFTSLERLNIEAAMERLADALATRPQGDGRGDLGPTPPKFALLIADPPVAKLDILTQVRLSWAAAEDRVQAITPGAHLADRLRSETGLPTISFNSLARQSACAAFAKPDVVLIDDAGLMNARDLTAIFTQAEVWQARVALVISARDFRAAEVGAACRALAERHGVYEIGSTDVGLRHRQPPGHLPLERLERLRSPVEGVIADPDYVRRFAERRSIHGRVRTALQPADRDDARIDGRSEERGRSGFDERGVHRAIRGYARATLAIHEALWRGRLTSPEQRRAVDLATHRVACLWTGADQTIAAVCAHEPSLLKTAAAGGTQALLGAMEALQADRQEKGLQERWSPERRIEGRWIQGSWRAIQLDDLSHER